MFSKLKDFLKQKLGVHHLKEENKHLQAQVNQLMSSIVQLSIKSDPSNKFITQKVAELKEYTRVDADIGIRGNNTIVLTGVYRGQAFVRFYDIGDGQFRALVEQMREMKDHCLIRNVDRPPGFSGIFDI